MTDDKRKREGEPEGEHDEQLEDLEIKDAEDAESVTGGTATQYKYDVA